MSNRNIHLTASSVAPSILATVEGTRTFGRHWPNMATHAVLVQRQVEDETKSAAPTLEFFDSEADMLDVVNALRAEVIDLGAHIAVAVWEWDWGPNLTQHGDGFLAPAWPANVTVAATYYGVAL